MSEQAIDSIERTEVLACEPTEALAALLDVDVPIAAGSPVPPLWHWMYLLERRRPREFGSDGHPLTGIPAPPGPGRRRMFGGGRVTTYRQLVLGQPATKRTSILRSIDKEARTGLLTVVTVLQEIRQGGELAIREEQDIVYRAAGTGSLPTPPPAPEPADGPTLSMAVDERTLFQFSALTYNAHRIHYDLSWTAKEGYDGLIIHGPLLALMMGEHMRRHEVDLRGRTFEYRFVSPMTRPQTFTVFPAVGGLEKGAEARSQQGAVCAVATLKDE